MAPTGALSAKIASLLDSKIDDGRPGRGRVLALKNGFARTATTTQQQYKTACYEGSSDNVHNSIYQASTDLKYGCNMTYILSPVK